jgi:osmotically-inducible protein OsmY
MRARFRTISLLLLGGLWWGAGCASLPGEDARSDASSPDVLLAQLVQDRLGQDAVTARNQFSVSASAGVVTVRGFVSNEPDRMRTLGVVRGTPGVQAVVDQLRIYK